jgi:hypothetical protein
MKFRHRHAVEKNGKISYWLQPTDYDNPGYADAWDKIGVIMTSMW